MEGRLEVWSVGVPLLLRVVWEVLTGCMVPDMEPDTEPDMEPDMGPDTEPDTEPDQLSKYPASDEDTGPTESKPFRADVGDVKELACWIWYGREVCAVISDASDEAYDWGIETGVLE